MILTKQEVLKIAKLAQIKLTDAEQEKYQRELTDILNYVNQLNEVDVPGIQPQSQLTGLENVIRKDEVSYNFSREEILASAIATEEGHLKVKNVF